MLNFEKKNLESGDEGSFEEQSVIVRDDENLGATDGDQSFVTGSEKSQEIAKDLGTIKDFEGITESGWLHRGLESFGEPDSQVGGEPGSSLLGKVKEISEIKTSFEAKEEGFQDQDIDPSVLELLTVNSVPITDPV